MTPGPSRGELLWLPIVLVALLVIYLPGLGNALVYDDSYLTEGLFTDYRSLLKLQPRMLSYGSFVWMHALLGDGWWKQRLVNLAIHLLETGALWALYREILRHIVVPADHATPGAPPVGYERSPALGFAIGFFALNPVAVYGVAYLLQRSILLATLFVTLGLWLFALALARRRWWLHLLALACYVLAVMSKEHAILAPLAAVPLYILVARPSRRRLATLALAGVAVCAVAAYPLWQRYGRILGNPFDEFSRIYLTQLARLSPDAQRHAYGLSVMNEAWLFLRYGFDWVVPWAGWMSINLRPPFPIHWLTLPQLLGPLAYVAVLVGGFWLVVRYRDGRALVGISLLFPALLFPTEFATVWVQDPFVLYRSYLWAIGIPGLVFFAIHGPSARALVLAGTIVAVLLVWQALDRVLSLQTAESAWTDAIEKLPNDARAVGRWFPYLNRGSAYVDQNRFPLAVRDFEASAALGDMGMGIFNIGSILSGTGKAREALEAFDRAEREGYDLYNLPFQRGIALLALKRPEEAFRQFQAAVAMRPPSPTRELALLHLGRTSIQIGRRPEAIRALEELVQIAPGNLEARYLLGMAYLTNNDPARAVQVFDKLLLSQASARAFYARAIANYGLKRKAQARSDIDNAIRMAGDNPSLRDWRAKIEAMP